MVSLASLDVAHLATELGVVEDAYVDKVYQTSPSEFLVRLRHRDTGRLDLLVRPGAWAALAKEPPQTPETPSAFAMALRKALANARVRRVRQHEFDRVLVLDLERAGEPFSLVIEFFGQGNLIVVGTDGRIHLAWRTETFRHRTVRKGEEFRFPPARPGPNDLTAEGLATLAKASKRDLVRFLAVEAGLGGDLAEAGIMEARSDKECKAADVPVEAFEAILRALRGILDRPATPMLFPGKNGPMVASVPLPQHTGEPARFATLSEAILAATGQEVTAEPPRKDPEHERLARQLGHQEDGVLRLVEEAKAQDEAAQAIYKDYAAFGTLLDRIRQAVDLEGWDGFAAASGGDTWPEVVDVDAAAKRVRVRWGGRALLVDPEASVESNASAAFDIVKQLRQKVEGARAAADETRRAIKRSEKRVAKEVRNERAETSLTRRRFWFMGYRWTYTTGGLLVIGGRDAASNEKVVKKHMKPGDLYLHADVHGAPSCVLKLEGQEADDASIEEACRFAAVYSKAFNQFASAEAFYVKPEQVSKTPQSGEYVPKGAFIIRGTRSYRRGLPMETGVGTVLLDDQGRPSPTGGHRVLMGGPWVSVRALSSDAVRVVRGERKASDVAKEVAARLEAPIDSVVAALPAANLAIEEASS